MNKNELRVGCNEYYPFLHEYYNCRAKQNQHDYHVTSMQVRMMHLKYCSELELFCEKFITAVCICTHQSSSFIYYYLSNLLIS